MRQLTFIFGIFLLGFFGLQSCNQDKDQDKVDVSNIKIDFVSKPFYKDFADLDTNNLGQSLLNLKAKYPNFTDFYLDTLLPFERVYGRYEDSKVLAPIKNIFAFKDYVQLTDTVLKVFANTSIYDAQIEDMLKHVKYYFKDIQLPNEVVYFTSCLNLWTGLQHKNTLGIGLDMFLGQDFKPYQAISIPYYALVNHTPENIPLWAAKSIYIDIDTANKYHKDLLELMINKGKEILFLKKVLPDYKFNLIMGYTPEQLTWAEKNEQMIFNMFLQQNLLFNKDYQTIMRYVTPGPNSAGFSDEAPGNLGTFIGYRILRAYEKQSGKSLTEILSETNANEIFQKSKYKP